MSSKQAKKAGRSDQVAFAIGIVIGLAVLLLLLYYMIIYNWWTSERFWLTATLSALIGWFAPPAGRALGNKGWLVLLVTFVVPQLLAAYVPWLKPYVGTYYLVFLVTSWWRVLYDVFVKRVHLF